MSEVVIKDSAIKLFGRTISLPRNTKNEVSPDEPAPPEDSSSSFPREVSSTTEYDAGDKVWAMMVYIRSLSLKYEKEYMCVCVCYGPI